MKTKITMLVALCALMLIALAVASPGEMKAKRDGMFIHISHGKDDPHRALMALQMAIKISDTKDVLIYCDIQAIDLVVKDAPNLEMEPFPPLKKALAILKERGVPIMACPGCLKAAGNTPEDLAEGVQIADKDAFFNFTSGRIITLDY